MSAEFLSLESRIPGLRQGFSRLLRMLPNPNNVNGTSTEHPVAAGILEKTSDGGYRLVAASTNRVNILNDSTAHAEIEVMKMAQKSASSKHLSEMILISTLQTCVMCSGATVNTDLEGVIYGASHLDVEGQHALVNGEYKPYRTTPEEFNTDAYLEASGVWVVGGYRRDEVIDTMSRTPTSIREYYADPDA